MRNRVLSFKKRNVASDFNEADEKSRFQAYVADMAIMAVDCGYSG